MVKGDAGVFGGMVIAGWVSLLDERGMPSKAGDGVGALLGGAGGDDEGEAEGESVGGEEGVDEALADGEAEAAGFLWFSEGLAWEMGRGSCVFAPVTRM